jgi:lipopolysaccharide export system protein LptA
LYTDRDQIHATGERAIYTTETGLARITGHPTWRADEREGRGDELIIDRAEKIFLANGQAYFKMTNGNKGIFLPTALATNSAASSNQFVEIHSDNYEFRTNMAFFREDVRVTEHEGDQLKGKMNCRLMTLTFSGTNELQSMIAEEKVIMEHDDQQFTAAKAVYTGTNDLLELTGNPAWRAGDREGKGDLLLVNPQHNEMNVKGNAFMRLPAQELAQATPTAATTAAAPAAPKAASSSNSTNQFADVFSDEYYVEPQLAVFKGNVRIDHPRMKWWCEKITAKLPSANEKDQSIVAEQKVVFDLIDEENQPGQKIHGTGDKAVYSYSVTATATNDLLALTGDPVLQTDKGTFQNRIILFDRAKNLLMAPGKYRIFGSGAPDLTSAFPTLKK